MIKAIPLGVYIPGDTWIHRLPPMVKFGFLIAFILGTAIFIKSAVAAAIATAFSLVLYVFAKIPAKIAFQQLWPPLPILAMLGAFQWWQLGFEPAARIVLVIFSALALANLLTLTTQIEEMMNGMEAALRPTERFGVPVETIVLAMSLTLRLLPLMLNTVNEVLDARKARGATFSIAAFGTPVMVRSIRRARGIGDALLARGVGD